MNNFCSRSIFREIGSLFNIFGGNSNNLMDIDGAKSNVYGNSYLLLESMLLLLKKVPKSENELNDLELKTINSIISMDISSNSKILKI